MSISKKDKQVLSILLIVMVVVLLVMFVIVPVHDELEKLEEQHAKLNKEVIALKTKYNNPANKPESFNYKIEQALMDYYKNMKSDVLVDNITPEIGFVNLLETIVPEDFGLFSPGGIEKKDIVDNVTIEGAVDPISVSCLEYSILYKIEFPSFNYDLSGLSDFFQKINNESRIYYRDFSLDYFEEEQIYKGTIRLYKYYIYEPTKIPLPLVPLDSDMTSAPDAPQIISDDFETKTLRFYDIPNAEYYEIYKIEQEKIEGETKNIFKLVASNITMEESTMVGEYYYGNNGLMVTGSRYVVTAVGNYKNSEAIKNGEQLYYRTILTDDLVMDKSFILK